MSLPIINVLIRTSNRKTLFRRCLKSVLNQTYKNINIICSYDTPIKPDYIPDNLKAISVIGTKEKYKDEEAFYNRYCNDLKQEVAAGFFVYLDDDDYIANKFKLEAISRYLKEGEVLICQMSRNGRKKPANVVKGIVSGKIGNPCWFVPTEFKDLANYGGIDNSDYHFIKELTGQVPYKFVPIVFAECGIRRYGK